MDEHYSENELDLLAKGTKEPPEDEHLERCLQCRARFLFLRQFHRALEEELRKRIDARVERLSTEISSAGVIELTPYQAEPDLSHLGRGEHMLVLAAKGIEPDNGPAISAMTFASSSAGAIVRVLHDHHRKSYRVHVLSGKGELCSHVVVVAGNPDGPITAAVTDARGMALLPDADAIDWGSAAVAIRTPRASFSLDAAGPGVQSFATEEVQASVFVGPASVAIELHSTLAQKYLYAVVLLDLGIAAMGAVSGEKATIPIPQGARPKEIRIY